MRIKTFLIICGCVLITSYLFILFGPAGRPNDSFDAIVSQTHQHIKELQENLGPIKKKLEVDPKYLSILGFTESIHQQPSQPQQPQSPNINRNNFSIVSYVLNGQAASAILLIQNIAFKLPNETLYLYDIGLSDDDSHALNAYCNTTKCTVIVYDLSQFPAYVSDERMHAFRPIIIKDALMRSSKILFIENNVRINGLTGDFRHKLMKHANDSGVLGWTTRQAVSSRTHPRMFDYFQTDDENFMFLPMVSMETVLFFDSNLVNDKILLPWIKCSLTQDCIHPIGAQSNGCRFNKKPLYRYSGCHAYDVSAFNIVLGLTWNFDETKYSLHDTNDFYYTETLEQATKILENKRKNSSDTSERPFTID